MADSPTLVECALSFVWMGMQWRGTTGLVYWMLLSRDPAAYFTSPRLPPMWRRAMQVATVGSAAVGIAALANKNSMPKHTAELAAFAFQASAYCA